MQILERLFEKFKLIGKFSSIGHEKYLAIFVAHRIKKNFQGCHQDMYKYFCFGQKKIKFDENYVTQPERHFNENAFDQGYRNWSSPNMTNLSEYFGKIY